MTLPQIISRNQIQAIPTTALNIRKTNESPAEFYTCPSGKKAVITGSCLCTGLGASSEVRLLVDGIAVLRFLAGDVSALVSKPFNVSLSATDTLAKGQNSGTNGELDLNCSILETPG